MKKEGVSQAIRFSLVGVLNTLVDYGVFYIMLSLFNVDKSISQLFATAVAMTGSYIINKYWTFAEKSRTSKTQIVKFIATNIVSMSLTIIFMSFFHDVLYVHEWMNKALDFADISFSLSGDIGIMFCKILASCLSMVINFLGNKFWVFKAKEVEK